MPPQARLSASITLSVQLYFQQAIAYIADKLAEGSSAIAGEILSGGTLTPFLVAALDLDQYAEQAWETERYVQLADEAWGDWHLHLASGQPCDTTPPALARVPPPMVMTHLPAALPAVQIRVPIRRSQPKNGGDSLTAPMGTKSWSTTDLVVVCLGVSLAVFFAGATASVAAGQTPPTAMWAAGSAIAGALIGLLVPSPGLKEAEKKAATEADKAAKQAEDSAAKAEQLPERPPSELLQRP